MFEKLYEKIINQSQPKELDQGVFDHREVRAAERWLTKHDNKNHAMYAANTAYSDSLYFVAFDMALSDEEMKREDFQRVYPGFASGE